MKPVNTYVVGWVFALFVICGFYIPRITQKGSFIDSLVYSTISHNQSEGIGTFWKPVLKNSDFLFYKGDIFYDHPPLMFGILSGFYKAFGDHADWIYSTIVLCVLFLGMWLLLKLFMPAAIPAPHYAFIPMVLFFTIPEGLQKVSYPLLDFTLAVFTTFAVYCFCRALHDGRKFLAWAALGGLFIVLAVLTKGPVGTFPLITPAMYYVVYRHESLRRKTIFSTAIATGVLIIAICIFYFYTPSRLFFAEYLDHQVLASIKGEREKAGTLLNHFSIIIKAVTQMMPMMVITLVIYLACRKWKKEQAMGIQKPVYFFMGIGLAASLPIAISAKHHSFYLFPSLVFYTLMFSYFISQQVPTLFLQSRKKVNTIILFFLIIGIILIFIISFGREKKYYHTHAAFLQQMEEMAPWLSKTKCMGVSEDVLHGRGDIGCYLERYFQIELEVYDPNKCAYYLMIKSDSSSPLNGNLLTQTAGFQLYKLQ